MSKRDHIGDDGTSVLPGIKIPSSSVRRSGQPVILSFQASNRRLVGLEDASDPVEGFESIGSLAVRIVGQFELPRLMVMAVRKGEEP